MSSFMLPFRATRAALAAAALLATVGAPAQDARFSEFTYSGRDARFDRTIDAATEYFNPVLAGFFPDPSLCRKGDTYYLVNSSFTFVPGVPLFTSRNLVDWEPQGGVLTRESQLPLAGQQVSAGIFAPAISYNPRNDTFYMITTNVGFANFFVKSKNPAQGWSEPIRLPQVDGIDPSFFFDKDGSAYIVHNGPVMGGDDYPGQRAIRLLRFDVEGDSILPLPATLPGTPKAKARKGAAAATVVGPAPAEMASNGYALEILRGGTHVQEHPIWIEGPHMFRRGNYYYLMCAEGGTCDWHSEVILRSRSPYGPWEEAPNNPILTQRTGLDPQRPDIVTSAGHADIVETPSGEWYAVFLGCRPYEDDFYNTGRDTYLLPVTWSKDGWPTILEPGKAVPTVNKRSEAVPTVNKRSGEGVPTVNKRSEAVPTVDKRSGEARNRADATLTGNFTYTDRFAEPALSWRWMTLRNHSRSFYCTGADGLTLRPSEENVFGRGAVHALFCRQQHSDFSAETTLAAYTPTSAGDLAGMVLLQNEKNNFIVGKTMRDGRVAVVLTRAEGSAVGATSLEGKRVVIGSAVLRQPDAPLRLKVEGHGRWYNFYYAEGAAADAGQWMPLAVGVDAVNLSTHASGGFIGAVIGLYNTLTNDK